MTAIEFSDSPLRIADRRLMEIEAGHLVHALCKRDICPTAAEKVAEKLDRLRSILAVNRYPRAKPDRDERVEEPVQ